MKKGQEWTRDQIQYLLDHYPSERAEDIAKQLGRSKSAIHKKAHNLGIGKDNIEFFKVRSKAQSGENSGNFKGYRRKTSKGYICCYMPDHPMATKSGLVMEHRLIIEKHLGFILPKNFVVHHLNGKKDDNRIENLAVMTSSAHSALHNKRDEKQRHGEEHPLYKKVDTEKMKSMEDAGCSVEEICKELGIKRTKYYRVKKGA